LSRISLIFFVSCTCPYHLAVNFLKSLGGFI
jgi:hypothetical protein